MAIEDRRITALLERLEKKLPEADRPLLKKLVELSGNDPETLLGMLQELAQYDYEHTPVDTETFLLHKDFLGLGGDRGQLYPGLIDILVEVFEGDYEEVYLDGAIGWGKCRSLDSEILYFRSGELHRATLRECIRDVLDGVPVDVFSEVNGTIRACRVTNACYSGVKPVYEVRLASGKREYLTEDHPVRTAGGYTRVRELSVGDLVATVRRYRFSGVPQPREKVIFTAYMLAEGSTTVNERGVYTNLSFTNADHQILDEFTEVSKALGATSVRSEVRGDCIMLYPNGLRPLVHSLGLVGDARTKRVPDWMLGADSESVALFLNRFFACDGSVSRRAPFKIETTLANRGLCEDLSFLLARLGIHARLVDKTKRYEKGGKEFYCCTLSITGRKNIATFLERVGPVFTKEYPEIESYAASTGRPSSNTDVLPIGYKEMKDVRAAVGGMSREEWSRWKCPEGQWYSRDRFESLVDEYGERVPRPYREIVSSDLYWDRVVSIEYVGECEVGDIEVPESHNFVGNGVVLHNSTLAECAVARMLYELSCLKNPQMFYGLDPSDTIAVLNVSVNKTQAKKVVYHRLKERVKASPYFREVFPFDPQVTSELRFPKNISAMPTAASEGGTVGYTVYGAVMDEVNFMDVVESSAQARGQKFDQAEYVHTLLKRRIKSRFVDRGGLLIAVSSSKYPDSFTERKRKEFEVRLEEWKQGLGPKPKVFIKRNTQWGPKPKHLFPKERFYLFLGSTAARPFITMKREDVEDYLKESPELVLEVPMNFWDDFKQNLHGSIRDIAGYPTLSIVPFMPEMDKIMDAIERGRQRGKVHPFSVDETTLQDGAFFDTDLCKFDRRKTYYAHVDLALRGDAAGLAIGHVEGWKKIPRRNPETGEMIFERQPIIEIDLMLRIKAPKGGEIRVSDVRGLLLQLRQYGCNLAKVTYDQFQSAESIQTLERYGIESEVLSVDRDMEAYNAMKEAAIEDRLILYDYRPFVEEVARLEKVEGANRGKGKVDHPPKGSKDVTDAVAGVCYHCTLEEAPVVLGPSLGDFMDTPVKTPEDWQNPAAGLEPTVDRHDRRKPGQRRRTVDDLMFPDDDEDPWAYAEKVYPIGFA